MKKSSFFTRTLATLALVSLVLAAYMLWARPYQLYWGATDEETHRPMPGDELDPDPTFLATRAITIEGTPEDIWPWLMQMGYGRAGFYGYDILENLGSQRGMLSADRILPEFQHFTVGDEVPISPVARMVFHAIVPDQFLIWTGTTGDQAGGFTWALYPADEQHTRLVSRIRWTHHWTQPDLLGLDLFTEFTDHIAVRKILHGVKDRVEGRVEAMVPQTIEFAIYVVAALIFLVAVVLILLRPLTWRRWLVGLAAGAVWLITWYAPIPAWMGTLLELLALGGLLWTSVRRHPRNPSLRL
ncbi:MAG: hypothetical protein M1546_25890 [Chloroflexi bacterium]|nr:hypothetical protein [Chloroflexota bacterium]